MNNYHTYCGYAAIIGRPNVGKSTLLNQLLGKKISVTSCKPQTTRYQILGVKTLKDIQIVYVDTPGLHSGKQRMINRYMNRTACSVLIDADVILFVIEPDWKMQDVFVLNTLQKVKAPVLLIINKVDKIKNRFELLPLIRKVSHLRTFRNIIPLSAKTGDQIEVLEQMIKQYIPKSLFYFPPEQVTNRDDQFMASEIIREKLMRLLGQEIPYSLAVTLVSFQKEKKITHISAVVWVEKRSQKGIVIGKCGEKLKKVGTNARLDLEKWFRKKVFLQLWVKIKSGWANNKQLLKELWLAE